METKGYIFRFDKRHRKVSSLILSINSIERFSSFDFVAHPNILLLPIDIA